MLKLDYLIFVFGISHSDEVLPLYCFDNTHDKKTEFGFNKTRNFRTQFLLESLRDLDNQLRALGSGLLILRGNPAEELVKVTNK